MEYIAIAKNIKISPRKMRLVVDGVKKSNLKVAVATLSVMNKRAAGPIKKAIDSAVANAVNNSKVEKDSLIIQDIIVTEGVRMKRFHYAARGRIRPYKRRASHVKVILSDNKLKAENLKSKMENQSLKEEKVHKKSKIGKETSKK